MSNRSTHRFQFAGKQIADAAAAECQYHRSRAEWWNTQFELAAAKAQEEGVKIERYPITGGERAQMVFDPELQRRIDECNSKRRSHQDAADRLAVESAAYGTQVERSYELDGDDVQHWRLAGGAREE